MLLSMVAIGSDARRVIRVDKLVLLIMTTCLMFHMLEASSRGLLQDSGQPSLNRAQTIRFAELEHTTHSPDKLLEADSDDLKFKDSKEFSGPVDGDHEDVQSPSKIISTRKDEKCSHFCFASKTASFVFQFLHPRPPVTPPPEDPTPSGPVGHGNLTSYNSLNQGSTSNLPIM